MAKANKPNSRENEQKKNKIIKQVWDNPIILNLINKTSWRVDILAEDKMRILKQDEIDALDNWFIKMILDYKNQMIELIDRKLEKLDIDSPIIKRVDEFINWVINNVPNYELDYIIRDILMQLPIIKWKKYWDFPNPYSAIEMFQNNIRELEAIPDILENPEENREILYWEISLQRKIITDLAVGKLWKLDWWIWWHVFKLEEYCNSLKWKYRENIWEYYSWHALIWSTPRVWWPHKYRDLVWEDSIISFLGWCIQELETMTEEQIESNKRKSALTMRIKISNYSESEVKEIKEVMTSMPEFNSEEVVEMYKKIATFRNNLSNISLEFLWDIWGMYWWYEKTQEYFHKVQEKYPNISDYFVWPFMIWGTPWEKWHKYTDDLLEPDWVMTFLENCKNELINMTKKEIEYYNNFTAETIRGLHKPK